MRIFLTTISVLLTLWPMYRLLFGSREEFVECLRYWITPDIVSLFRGKFWEDSWAELKLGVWIGSAALVGFGDYNL